MTTVGGLSPIEVLLPGGRAQRALVLGSGCPQTLRPADPSGDSGALDLVVIAPSRAESETRGWIAGAVAEGGERLGPNGCAYVLVPPRARPGVRRALRAHGLVVDRSMLHLPDAAQSRLLVQLERAAVAHAFGVISPLAPWKRAVARLLFGLGGGRAMAASRADVGMLARRRDGLPPLTWLPASATRSAGGRAAIVSRSPRADGSRLVIHPFADGTAAPYVAKLRPPGPGDSETERLRLERIGSTAAQAGAFVPTALDVLDVHGAEFLLESRVPGQLLAPLLTRDGSRLDRELARVSDWLAEWSRVTATATVLTAERLEGEVLAPARAVAPALTDGPAYLAWLGERCADLVGTQVPLTASHNDLSTWNLLVDGERLGVIDWEGAEDASLPFKDFFYVAADAAAAAGHYEHRRDAAEACFTAGGAHAHVVATLQAQLSQALEVRADVLELSFHACWLKHGAYEARKHAGARETPFRDILQWLAVRATGASI